MESQGLSCFMLFYLREGSRSYEREVGPRYNVYYVVQCVSVDDDEEEL